MTSCVYLDHQKVRISMKQIIPFIVFFGVSSAFATEKVCEVTSKTSAGTNVTTEVLVPYVLPGADLASYVLDKNVDGFELHFTEVDGNYFGNILFGTATVSSQAVEEITLSATLGKRSISVHCY